MLGLKNMNSDKKSIYKITNKINGKIYIGQSKNPKDRFQQHCAPSNTNTILGKAIHKYGKENFSFEIIEENILNYNEKEKYWISYYDSLTPKGYNISIGGSGSSGKLVSGENNASSIYLQSTIDKIIQDLLYTDKTYLEIAKAYRINNIETISAINTGKAWKKQNLIYPIRQSKSEYVKEQYEEVIKLLQQNKTNKEIEQLTGLGHSTIDKINKGIIKYNDVFEKYPIRTVQESGTNKTTYDKNKAIIKELKTTDKSFQKIADEFHYSLSQIYKINSGEIKSGSNENTKYPIRSIKTQRQKSKRLNKDQVAQIRALLNNTKISYKDIARRFNTTSWVISKINTGKSYHSSIIQYPIRGVK